ncbi:ABC transporter ATP-binding protein [bacterium]|nr:MAG: ABC transporter ATP-binding protein [bacterium]
METHSLKKYYGDIRALDGLDLKVGQGEIYGFLGPNGAGKTTTIRILTGTARPTSGEAFAGGFDVQKNPVAAKAAFGVVSQHSNIDSDLTVRENLELHGILHGMGRERRNSRIAELLSFADLAAREHHLARTLSGGMKRKLTIIRALLHEPKILFLDEPTTGLDAGSRRRMWDLVRSIHEGGVSVFLTTHYIEEAEALCRRVGIIDSGKLIAEGTPEELVRGLGTIAVDVSEDGRTVTSYFQTREAAGEFLGKSGKNGRIRPTSLEDLFLKLTGRRVSA